MEEFAESKFKGWYRYDTYFAMPVQGSNEEDKRVNIYRATLVVRSSLKGLYLCDVINIKKEASKPLQSKDRTVENRSSIQLTIE